MENPDNNLVLSLDMSGDWSLNAIYGLFTPNSDFHDIQALDIATSQLEAYLHVKSTICRDVAGNPLVPIAQADRIRMVGGRRILLLLLLQLLHLLLVVLFIISCQLPKSCENVCASGAHCSSFQSGYGCGPSEPYFQSTSVWWEPDSCRFHRPPGVPGPQTKICSAIDLKVR